MRSRPSKRPAAAGLHPQSGGALSLRTLRLREKDSARNLRLRKKIGSSEKSMGAYSLMDRFKTAVTGDYGGFLVIEAGRFSGFDMIHGGRLPCELHSH